MTHRSRPAIAGIAGCLIAALLAGCADDAYVGSGEWERKPSPAAPEAPGPQKPSPPSGSDPSTPQQQDDMVRATNLDQPSSIAPLPDGTAFVAERTSGKVTRVYPTKAMPAQLAFTVPDIDAANGGGLLSIVASPHYAENGLIFAFVTTATEGQVVTINAAGVPKPVITGLPRSAGALAIGPDGSVLVATGGSGDALAGKILSTDPWGGPGPSATNGLIVGTGVPNPLGLCSDGVNVYVVDGGSGAAGSLSGNAVFKVAGEPTDSGGLGNANDPLIAYTAGKDAGAAACLATETAIITAGTDSQSLMTSVLDKDGQPTSEPTLSLTGTYGRLRALALDPVKGGLWIATYNRDGIGTPGAEDDRVLYVPLPEGGGGGDVS